MQNGGIYDSSPCENSTPPERYKNKMGSHKKMDLLKKV